MNFCLQLRVGEIVYVQKNDVVPADVVLLSSRFEHSTVACTDELVDYCHCFQRAGGDGVHRDIESGR